MVGGVEVAKRSQESVTLRLACERKWASACTRVTRVTVLSVRVREKGGGRPRTAQRVVVFRGDVAMLQVHHQIVLRARRCIQIARERQHACNGSGVSWRFQHSVGGGMHRKKVDTRGDCGGFALDGEVGRSENGGGGSLRWEGGRGGLLLLTRSTPPPPAGWNELLSCLADDLA